MVENQASRHAAGERRFVENLRRLREEQGWTQTDLARRMVAAGWDNYTQMTVSRTEKFERPVRLSEAYSLATVLGSSPEELIGAGLNRSSDLVLEGAGSLPRETKDLLFNMSRQLLAANLRVDELPRQGTDGEHSEEA